MNLHIQQLFQIQNLQNLSTGTKTNSTKINTTFGHLYPSHLLHCSEGKKPGFKKGARSCVGQGGVFGGLVGIVGTKDLA